MAGIAVRMVSNAASVAREIGAVKARARDLRPAMKRVGEHMLRSVEENFRQQGRPHRWRPLKPATLARKRHAKILTERGGLRRSITYRAGRRELEVGTNKVYARPHQLGSPDQGIPARPFLVIHAADRVAIAEIVDDYIVEGR